MDESRIIIALDVPYEHQAINITTHFTSLNPGYKVGLELFMDTGLKFVRQLTHNNMVMLDLKLSDIPKTVEKAVRRICISNPKPTLLTIRGSRQEERASVDVVDAAIEGRGDNEYPKILLVPRLSTENPHHMNDEYYLKQEIEGVELYCRCDGYVASGKRIALIRKAAPDKLIVAPGIRPEGATKDGHKEASTARAALDAGANYLVVGRPITQADHPVKAYKKILDEISR